MSSRSANRQDYLQIDRLFTNYLRRATGRVLGRVLGLQGPPDLNKVGLNLPQVEPLRRATGYASLDLSPDSPIAIPFVR